MLNRWDPKLVDSENLCRIFALTTISSSDSDFSSNLIRIHNVLSAAISISYFLRIFTSFFNLRWIIPMSGAKMQRSSNYSRWLTSHWFPAIYFISISSSRFPKASSSTSCTRFQQQPISSTLFNIVTSSSKIMLSATTSSSGLKPSKWVSIRQG